MIRGLAFTIALPLALAACGGGQEAPEADTPDTTEQTAEAPAPAAISGKDSYKKCMACHKLEKGAPNSVGPNLHGIVGKAVASAEGFNYSTALKAKGGVWDEASLDAYLENPRKAVPGGKMAFAGINNAEERKALIAYLAEQN